MNQDLISRQAILKHIEKIRQGALMMDDTRRASIVMSGMHLCEGAVWNQPSAQPEKMQLSKEDATKGTTFDCISRQAAIDSVCEVCENCEYFKNEKLIQTIKDLPSAQPRWIPVTERLPDDLEEVNITFTNIAPEPYYDFIKGKRFTGSAVFYKGEWYWYSSITVDVLKEYGRYESEKIDDGLKIVAWMPLPDPYREEEQDD